jgi:murein DD-endopeptidase MepM/ murein hydrolase activator NlpD
MVLNSEDPTELSGQLNSVRNVLDKESVTLDRLDASRVLLEVKEDEVEQAKREVAKKRREAAENLERKKVLEAQAEDAEKAVSTLVSARAEAHGAAAEAKRADLESLRGLQQERDRISDVLAARAEEARRRAEAAAAAAAAQASAASRGSNGFLDYPVNTYITSSYGMRLHPVYHRWTLHDGTDFGAPCGTPIRAAASGEVIAVYYNPGYGNRVIMDNGYHRGVGLGTAYNHLSSYSTYEGQKVKRGEVIGYVGNTGYSTGCHLHFMVFENGATVNPMNWL